MSGFTAAAAGRAPTTPYRGNPIGVIEGSISCNLPPYRCSVRTCHRGTCKIGGRFQHCTGMSKKGGDGGGVACWFRPRRSAVLKAGQSDRILGQSGGDEESDSFIQHEARRGNTPKKEAGSYYLGRVLGPPPSEGAEWWDSYCFGGPIVIPGKPHPPDETPEENVHTGDSGRSALVDRSSRHQPVAVGYDGQGSGLRSGPQGPVEGRAKTGLLTIPEHKWRMYYFGRDSSMWSKGVKATTPAPLGRVGLALSDDGIHWERFRGPLRGGAIFDPCDDVAAFDAVHVSVCEVIPPNEGGAWHVPAEASGETSTNLRDGSSLWRLVYFGGGLKESCTEAPEKAPAAGSSSEIGKGKDASSGVNGSESPLPASLARGTGHIAAAAKSGGVYGDSDNTFRIGVATSSDGVLFERQGVPLLDVGAEGELDHRGVVFSRVVYLASAERSQEECLHVGGEREDRGTRVEEKGKPPEGQGGKVQTGGDKEQGAQKRGQRWLMTYHTFGTDTESSDSEPKFMAMAAESDDGHCWQKVGKVLTAGVPGAWDEMGIGARDVIQVDGRYAMLYTGLNKKGEYSIGLAFSEDGYTWQKSAGGPGTEPGGPVLVARSDAAAWDDWVLGGLHVIERANGDFWMYYMGCTRGEEDRMITGIDLAVCTDRSLANWNRYQV